MKKLCELDEEKLTRAVNYFLNTVLGADWPGGEDARELLAIVAETRNADLVDNALCAAIELSACWDRIKYMKLAPGDSTPMTDEGWLQSVGISWRA